MTKRAGLRRTELLTHLTDRSVIGVTRARTRTQTVKPKSSVRSVRAQQLPGARGEKLLREAASVFANRCKQYGGPRAFFQALAMRWSLTLGHTVTPAQVVLCMIDLKLERLTNNPAHKDSIVDIAGYAAVLHEVMQ